jgi:protein arginine N-methyltransferase 5
VQTETQTSGLAQYARAILEALNVAAYVQISIQLPMVDAPDADAQTEIGDLAPFAREEYTENLDAMEGIKPDLFGTWDAWNTIRSICKYNPRLFVGKISMKFKFIITHSVPRNIPQLPQLHTSTSPS